MVRWKDSKLTRMLRAPLSEDGGCVVIAHCRLERRYLHELKSTLRFASRCRHIHIQAPIEVRRAAVEHQLATNPAHLPDAPLQPPSALLHAQRAPSSHVESADRTARESTANDDNAGGGDALAHVAANGSAAASAPHASMRSALSVDAAAAAAAAAAPSARVEAYVESEHGALAQQQRRMQQMAAAQVTPTKPPPPPTPHAPPLI